ncbi:glycosyltransferase family 2 protein [Mucilaginibacter arboris]|uniref:Glycosyltransferase n=1 Tax=Mucilaginibacter arboris TaxID=2682090 RepID=A0A7K1STI9_9SPHI|nr:glycosyltransferase family 2 protein [Mucilaginibacter arboris]MVN20622.1 glycosyltransferase [Mucilaginibacter arboris]
MSKPLVSIIIPVYNAQKYIAETITSAIKQTWENKEILIIDDGSEDASFSIAKSYESKTIKVFLQAKQGASAARNKGIKEAKGDYIQFLDADDLLEETKIEQQLKAINFSNSQLGICPVIHFPDGQSYKNFSPSDYEKNFYKSNSNPLQFLLKLYGAENNQGGMIALHAWLTPAELIKKAGFWNESLTVDDDGEYFCRVVLAASKIVCTNETLCYYRKYQNKISLSSQLNIEGFESRLNALELKQQHLAAIDTQELVNNIFARHYWDFALSAYPRFKKLSARAILQAKAGNYTGRKYSGGPISFFLSRFFGWRILRYISYIRYGF